MPCPPAFPAIPTPPTPDPPPRFTQSLATFHIVCPQTLEEKEETATDDSVVEDHTGEEAGARSETGGEVGDAVAAAVAAAATAVVALPPGVGADAEEVEAEAKAEAEGEAKTETKTGVRREVEEEAGVKAEMDVEVKLGAGAGARAAAGNGVAQAESEASTQPWPSLDGRGDGMSDGKSGTGLNSKGDVSIGSPGSATAMGYVTSVASGVGVDCVVNRVATVNGAATALIASDKRKQLDGQGERNWPMMSTQHDTVAIEPSPDAQQLTAGTGTATEQVPASSTPATSQATQHPTHPPPALHRTTPHQATPRHATPHHIHAIPTAVAAQSRSGANCAVRGAPNHRTTWARLRREGARVWSDALSCAHTHRSHRMPSHYTTRHHITPHNTPPPTPHLIPPHPTPPHQYPTNIPPTIHLTPPNPTPHQPNPT